MMKPGFFMPQQFHIDLTARVERSFLVRRHTFRCSRGPDWRFCDRDGQSWRPVPQEWDSDGASIPHPLDWIVPAFDPYRYRQSAMGIHDPACRFGELEKWDAHSMTWVRVTVPRSLADSLLQQGIQAEGGWMLTRGAYWLGVRIGSGFRD
jgi:hypothetical protein